MLRTLITATLVAAAQGRGAPAVEAPDWQVWWAHNRPAHVDLKAHVFDARIVEFRGTAVDCGSGSREQDPDALRVSPEAAHGKVVPALLLALRRQESVDLAEASLLALANIGDGPGGDHDVAGGVEVGPILLRHLTHPSGPVADAALLGLGVLARADARSVDALARVLQDPDTSQRQRALAAYALGLIGRRAEPAGRGPIVEALLIAWTGEAGKPSPDVAVACVTSLGLVPEPSPKWRVQRLLEALEEPRRHDLERAHAATAIARLLAAGRRGPELELLRVRAAERLVAHLERRRESPALLQSCALALGLLGDADTDPVDARIRSALISTHVNARDAHARAFALIALAQVAGRGGDGVGETAAAWRARYHLLGAVEHGDSLSRTFGALALGLLERSLADRGVAVPPDAGRVLRHELQRAQDPAEVGALAIGLGLLRDEQAGDVLLARMEQVRDDGAIGHLCVALGMLNQRHAIEEIQEVLDRSKYKPARLRSAAEALALLGDKTVVNELHGKLAEATGLSSQASILFSMATVGDARSVSPLLAHLEDEEKTRLSRAFAAAALGEIAARGTRPWNSVFAVGVNYRAAAPTLSSPERGRGLLEYR